MLETGSRGSKIILKAIAVADAQCPLMTLLMIPIGMTRTRVRLSSKGGEISTPVSGSVVSSVCLPFASIPCFIVTCYMQSSIRWLRRWLRDVRNDHTMYMAWGARILHKLRAVVDCSSSSSII